MYRNLYNKCFCKATALTVLAIVLFAQVQIFGAKGGGKEKKGYVLKFSGFEVKNSLQNSMMGKTGVFYKGSFNNVVRSPQQTTINSIITYQKGNTIFVYPYEHKVSVPKFKTPQASPY